MTNFDFKTNWNLCGHRNVVDYLKTSIRNGQVSHAYLFSGQRHLGKKTLAGRFVSALLCERDKNGGFCGECSACRQLEKNLHPDVLWLDQLTDAKTDKLKKNISIEQIREVKEKLGLSSFLNSYKIAVINQAELLSTEAANALLKLLEEPAERVVLILIAKDTESLPATVLSRCQHLHFNSVANEEIYHYLISLGAGRDQAVELSHLANGQPGLAVRYHKDNDLYLDYQGKVRDFLNLTASDLNQQFKVISDLAKEKGEGIVSRSKELVELLDIWTGIVRDLILLQASPAETPSGLINFWLQNQLNQAKLYTVSSLKLQAWLKEVEQTKRLLTQNVNPQLALESLILSL